ncbi:efflux RND transporter periplasmic adaptor subunit [Thiomicrorhabdus chilensis]|uniref:efflux RND transporter periplasmic adaptor subunit n=1 Tax=Thiomicrorhabdus chilensis TaxID=63656 RepID=UPI0003F6245A|nr:efflux RND transporter periplasmic adaptor subunit [Thiomicrorhabdus chilensis]
MRKNWILPFVLVAAYLQANPAFAKPPVQVIAYEASLTSQPQMIKALGQLQAKESIDISANVTDTIHAIHFSAGQTVRKSQLLLELNSAEELAALEEAKALAEEANLQYRRVKEVVGRSSVTQSMVDQKYREWQTAIAKRKVIEAQVADRRIYAPFAGQLGVSPFSVGALVTPGTKIVSLDNTQEMKLDLLISTQHLRYLKIGQNVTLSTPAFPNKTFVGTINAISPRLEQNVRMAQVQALIGNPAGLLKANMMVEAQIDLPNKTQLSVPNTAVLMLGDKEFVYRLHASQDGNHQAEKVEIQGGKIGPSMTEILSGLQAGDLVVSQGVMRVNSKVPVAIKAMQNQASQETLLRPVKQSNSQQAP